MNFLIKTLGCKVNHHDSEELAAKLERNSFLQTKKISEADFIIVNSCTVTHSADRKSRQSAMNLKKINPQAKIIVMGCSAKINAAQFQKISFVSGKIEEIFNYIITNREKDPLLNLPTTGNLTQNKNDLVPQRTRANIKIQTGCDNYCSYCIIPFARGKSESLPSSEIISEIQKKEELGFQEIVITGINIGAYGASQTTKPHENTLAKLLNKILVQTKIPRIRLSSMGPEYFSNELIELLINPRICQHLHLSIQSGSNGVLQRMNRHYNIESVIQLSQKLRETMPDIALTSDIIVGFPEESESEFQETLENLAKIKLMKTHIFPYSIRQGTAAAKLPQIEHTLKVERKKKLASLATQMRQSFLKSQIEKTKKVLFELKNKTGLWEGYTDNYIRVKIKSNKNLENVIREIKLGKGVLFSE